MTRPFDDENNPYVNLTVFGILDNNGSVLRQIVPNDITFIPATWAEMAVM